jgi:hypothetical protein
MNRMDIRKQLDGLKKASLNLALQNIDESYNKIQEHNKQVDRSGAFIPPEWFTTLDELITEHIAVMTNFQNNIQNRISE